MTKPILYSKIVAGTMTWGSWGNGLSTAEMITLMQEAISCGITTFDHADIYGSYTTEGDFGAALTQSNIPRENIQLITKCGIQMVSENRSTKIKHYDYSKAHITWSVHQSLKELQTDYIDLLLLHRPSPLLDVREVADTILALQDAGKIKEFGVSNFTPLQVALLQQEIPVRVNQIECSLLHTDMMYNGTLDAAQQYGQVAMAWSPLGGFFGKETEKTKRISTVLKGLQVKYDADESQLLLAWLMQHPSGIRPVVGTTKAQRLNEAVAATKIILEVADWFTLLKASLGHDVP